MKKIWMLFLLMLVIAPMAIAQDLAVRRIAHTNDVTHAGMDQDWVRWVQGESVDYDVYTHRGDDVVDLSGDGIWALWEVARRGRTDTAYVVSTGTVENVSTAQVHFELTPDESAIPEGRYESIVTLYQTVGTNTVHVGVVARNQLEVMWSPSGTTYNYVGPYTHGLNPEEVESGYNSQVDVVSQAVAEAGTSTNVYRWTSQRVAQAIAALETADMTGAEIKTAYEAEANAYTDTLNTKLAAIEAGATADQTGAEIKTAYEAEANAYTDTLNTKLAAIEAGATAETTATETTAGIVEYATAAEVDAANLTPANPGKVVRATHLRIRYEGGGLILTGSSQPTDDGANTGDNTLITGWKNYDNASPASLITGYYHYGNSGALNTFGGRGQHSGTGSFSITHGYYNDSNDGDYAALFGNDNSGNQGEAVLIWGEDNHSNIGGWSTIGGDSNDTNSGNFVSISGAQASGNALDYARVHGGGSNVRLIELPMQINSVSTTATELLLGGSGGTRAIIPDQSAWSVVVHFACKTATGLNSSSQRVYGLIARDGTTTTWALDEAKTQVDIGTSNATFTVSADNTNEALKLEVTCSSGTVRAGARVILTQVDY